MGSRDDLAEGRDDEATYYLTRRGCLLCGSRGERVGVREKLAVRRRDPVANKGKWCSRGGRTFQCSPAEVSSEWRGPLLHRTTLCSRHARRLCARHALVCGVGRQYILQATRARECNGRELLGELLSPLADALLAAVLLDGSHWPPAHVHAARHGVIERELLAHRTRRHLVPERACKGA